MRNLSSLSDWIQIERRHALWGWMSLLVFLSLGIALETFHGFKVGFYLDPPNELRRELWRLAHAHGTLLGIINLLFAFSISRFHWNSLPQAQFGSVLLRLSTLFMPAGFFFGGVSPSEGDPAPMIWLVPAGAVFLLGAVMLAAYHAWQWSRSPDGGYEEVHT